ncbi:MAG: NAD-dependent epimerase/dehydratase family protein, partial [Ferruginibacter sp.]
NINVTGTCLEYGMLEGCLNEEMEVKPTTSYGIAKNELRIKLQKLSEEFPFNFKWMRLFYMFGNGQNPKSLISQLDKALVNNEEEFKMSGGQQVRDFLPVETVAEYIVKAASQDVVTGVINCCSGKPITVYDFIINYLEENNKSIKLKPGYYPYTSYEPMEFWGNTKKLRLITGL